LNGSDKITDVQFPQEGIKLAGRETSRWLHDLGGTRLRMPLKEPWTVRSIILGLFEKAVDGRITGFQCFGGMSGCWKFHRDCNSNQDSFSGWVLYLIHDFQRCSSAKSTNRPSCSWSKVNGIELDTIIREQPEMRIWIWCSAKFDPRQRVSEWIWLTSGEILRPVRPQQCNHIDRPRSSFLSLLEFSFTISVIQTHIATLRENWFMLKIKGNTILNLTIGRSLVPVSIFQNHRTEEHTRDSKSNRAWYLPD
jgi:hypothetical protein